MLKEGIYLIDKEAGWTSFDVVAKMRRLSGVRSIGHAGTLDPFATGLLIVLVGKENTKKQSDYMKLDKEYEAEILLGKTSTTGDPEGVIRENVKCKRVNVEEIEEVLGGFVGEIEQTPPQYSAIKVGGVRAYKIARSGGEVKIEPRKVTIYSAVILNYTCPTNLSSRREFPILKIRVKCSSGTYIRTLASDIGERLGVGGYLTALRRTSIGEYKISEAKKIDKLI